MANDAPSAQHSNQPSDDEQRLERFVCRIFGGSEKNRLGTGILIANNQVLTCAHVLAAAADGKVVDADVMATISC